MNDPKIVRVCLVWHSFNSPNFGVDALSIANYELVREAALIAGLELQCVFVGNGCSDDNVSQLEFVPLSISFDGFLRKVLRLLKVFRSADLIIDISEGDSFSDIYGEKRFFKQILVKALAIGSGSPLVLAPQTIGPFAARRSRMLASLIIGRCVSVWARDNVSKAVVDSVQKFVRADLTADVAFSLKYKQPLIQDECAGVNISGLLWKGGYTGRNEFDLLIDYRQAMLAIVLKMLDYGYNEVRLIPHVLGGAASLEGDFFACGDLERMLPVSKRKFVKIISPMSAVEAKTAISACKIFVGARMHSTIGAVSAGVPTLPIAYSVKFKDLFRQFGYDLLFDAREESQPELMKKVEDLHVRREKWRGDALRCACDATKSLTNYKEGIASVIKRSFDNRRSR